MSVVKTYSDEMKNIEIKLLDTQCPSGAVEQESRTVENTLSTVTPN